MSTAPTAPPDGAGPTPLLRVGEVALPPSDTVGGPLGGLGSRLVTGAAASADGRVVALRSYTDAWLYRVPADGDLVAALTGRPVRVPLPGEPQGEAIAFEPSGTLVSGSETRGGAPGEIRAIADAAGLAVDDPAGSDQAAPDPGAPDSTAVPAASGTDAAAPDRTVDAGVVARGDRRGRARRVPAPRDDRAGAARHAPPLSRPTAGQSRRSTATTRPSTVASSPGMGS